jgi:hypothetical protein
MDNLEEIMMGFVYDRDVLGLQMFLWQFRQPLTPQDTFASDSPYEQIPDTDDFDEEDPNIFPTVADFIEAKPDLLLNVLELYGRGNPDILRTTSSLNLIQLLDREREETIPTPANMRDDERAIVRALKDFGYKTQHAIFI